ncbi:MAG: hypothetical protein AAGG79_03155 [Pseudomonadota bacterium]
MNDQFIIIVAVVAAIIIASFLVKAAIGNALVLVGLLAIAFLGRREAQGQEGFEWLLPYDMALIAIGALAAWLVSRGLSVLIFKNNGIGRGLISPLIAVTIAYGTGYFLNI